MADSELIVNFIGKDKSLSSVANKLGKPFQQLGGVVKAGAAIAGTALVGLGAVVVGAGAKLIGLGSDAEEMLGKFNVVFAETGGRVTSELETFADTVGRSKFELMEMASTFGDTLKPMGFAEDAAASMSVELTKLATDLGSFNNMPMDEALQRLQGTMIGNHENALAFGVIINENTLKAELAANGWDNLTGAALEQAKVQARMNLLMAGTTDAQGDAERTSQSWANQIRGLKATITDWATEMGLKLLPVFTPLLEKLGVLAGEWLPKLGDILSTVIVPIIEDAISFFQGLFVELGNGLDPVQAIIEALLTWTNFGENMPQEMFDFVIKLADGWETLKVKVIEFVTPIGQWIASFFEWKDVLIALGIVIGGIVLSAVIGLLAAIAPIALTIAAIIGVVALLRNAWEVDFGGIRDFAAGIWESIKMTWEAFKLLFSGDWDGFLLKIKAAWEIGWNATVEFLGNLWDMVSPKLTEWWEAVKAWFIETDWKGLAQTAIDYIVEKLGEFWSFVEPKLTEWWDALNEWWNGIDWKDLAYRSVTWILEDLADFWARAKPVLTSWWTSIKEWWDGIDWAQLARDVLDGLVSGLSGGEGIIGDKLRSIGEGAMAAWNDFWDNRSPSHLMESNVRDFIGGGMLRGLDQVESMLQGKMVSIAATMSNPIGSVNHSRTTNITNNITTGRVDVPGLTQIGLQFANGGI